MALSWHQQGRCYGLFRRNGLKEDVGSRINYFRNVYVSFFISQTLLTPDDWNTKWAEQQKDHVGLRKCQKLLWK